MTNDQLKLSDKLAIDRTVFAADRSLLAWVRTAVSLISFGFTMFKFLQYVQTLEQVPKLTRSHTPRNIGLFLLIVGTLPLLLAMIDYVQAVNRLTGLGLKTLLRRPTLLTALAIFLLGLFLTITMVLKIEFM